MTVQEGGVDPSVILIAASVVAVTSIVVAFLGCMWCRNQWKKLTRRHHYQFTDAPQPASSPPLDGATEFTLFPPPSGIIQFPTGISPDEVVFEPLPEIRSRIAGTTAENVRPARFTGSCEKVSLQDWFDEYAVNFPRDQLQYVREVGPTWYGQAVEGEALLKGEKKRVVVKILRVDATSQELMQYLQETRFCRDLKHPHLLGLMHRCLEVHPFLLIMEHCDIDLKSYLIEQRKSPEVLLRNGMLLRMACDIASALQYMHEHGFVHMDVAAHSCLVTSDSVVKLGDYGTAVHLHKSDFYILGDVAFPIRWCGPETLMCTDSVVEARDITREANIWSFGILLWELLEFGKLPYVESSDNDVIQRVLVEGSLRLEQPKTPCAHNDMIYKIMQLCWLPPSMRPSIQKIFSLLCYLYDNRDSESSSAFESRWNALQPPMTTNHNLARRPPANLPLKFESDFTGGSYSSDFDGDKSPSGGSISLGDLAADMSPSLLNLHGSVEDLPSSTVMGDTDAVNGYSEEPSEPSMFSNIPAGDHRYDDSSEPSTSEPSMSSSMSEPDFKNGVASTAADISVVRDHRSSPSEFVKNQHDEPSPLNSSAEKCTKPFPFQSGNLYEPSTFDTSYQQLDKFSERGASDVNRLNKLPEQASNVNKSGPSVCESSTFGDDPKNSEPSRLFLNDDFSEPPSLDNPSSETSDSIQLRITEAIQDLDTILAEEVSCSEASACNTPEMKPRKVGQQHIKTPNGDVAVDLEEPNKEMLGQKTEGGYVNVSMVDD
ncbi:hypothetical protein JTE90_006075 [Oedothorax gibbosus]|uniref:Protein kinase domain-containing protein n=1 Tax=Oedothorax gibbosus TaxID=931172 RepID=A0AAV6V5E2_9ARAC|nr:hypothetical protein JTE90_006075 [Oedothorax gibbosus]